MAQEWNGTYSISGERAEAAAKLAGISEERLGDICTYDWPEGEEHQRWLDSAPVEDIASWAAGIAREEDAAASIEREESRLMDETNS